MYNSRATGNEKEALAADHLAGRGYEILCRNFRVASGEIDIVDLLMAEEYEFVTVEELILP